MTELEKEKFYSLDKKDYDIKNNEKFVKTFYGKNCIYYKPYLTLDEIEIFINNVVGWYELKISNSQLSLDSNNNVIDLGSELEKNMTFNNFMTRRSVNEQLFLDCRSKIESFEYEVESLEDENLTLSLKIYLKNMIEPLNIFLEGIIDNLFFGTIKEKYDYNEHKDILKDLLKKSKISNKKSKKDYYLYQKITQNYQINLNIRKYILKLIALKMLYSKSTEPEFGLYRAKKFINEFNDYCKIDIDILFLESIMEKDYKNIILESKEEVEEIKSSKLKRLIFKK